jgi:hypothetical protein
LARRNEHIAEETFNQPTGILKNIFWGYNDRRFFVVGLSSDGRRNLEW